MGMKYPEYPYKQAAHYSGRRGLEPTIIVLHYSAGRGDADKLGAFFAGGSRKASSHFGVSREPDADGIDVWQYVDTDDNAWHAGKSRFKDGYGNIGRRSIGIELCNTGWAYLKDDQPVYPGKHRNPASRPDRWEPFRWTQQQAIEKLCAKLKEAHPTLQYITGHEDIRNTGVVEGLKGSKTDPGPAFPWETTDFGELEQWHWSYEREIWYSGNPTD